MERLRHIWTNADQFRYSSRPISLLLLIGVGLLHPFCISCRADGETYARSVYTIITGSGSRFDYPEEVAPTGNPIDREFERFSDVGVHGRAIAYVDTAGSGSLGVLAMAHTNPNNPVMTLTSQTTASARFGDTSRFSEIPLTVHGIDAVSMRYAVVLDGSFLSSNPGLANLTGSITAILSVAGFSSQGFINYNGSLATFSGFQIDSTALTFQGALLTVDVPILGTLVEDPQVDFSFELTTMARASNRPYLLGPGITMTTDALHTLKFSALQIVLSDGSTVTPESLGIDVSFDSGIQSPNVVPEVNALFLGASVSAVFVLGFVRAQQRRRQVEIGSA